MSLIVIASILGAAIVLGLRFGVRRLRVASTVAGGTLRTRWFVVLLAGALATMLRVDSVQAITYQQTDVLPVLFSPKCVAVGDLNSDGRPDLAVSGSVDSKVSIRMGNGDGTFGPETLFYGGYYVLAIAMRDLNRDGALDLVTVDDANADVDVFLGTGTGSFGPGTTFSTGLAPGDLAVGDFNGDGVADLAVPDFTPSTVSVLLGTGTGSFDPKTDFPVRFSPRHIASGDINGDGQLDIVAGSSILYGDGDGGFSASANVNVNADAPIALADLNGDGALDIVAADTSRDTVHVLLGTGTGSFGAITDYPTGTSPSSLAIGDLNRDGRLDAVVTNSNLSDNTVSVLLGTGAGGFFPKSDFPVGQQPWSVAIDRFDADQLPDLVVANSGGWSVSILLQVTAVGGIAEQPNVTALPASSSDHTRRYALGIALAVLSVAGATAWYVRRKQAACAAVDREPDTR